jgi:hypothetical protein
VVKLIEFTFKPINLFSLGSYKGYDKNISVCNRLGVGVANSSNMGNSLAQSRTGTQETIKTLINGRG